MHRSADAAVSTLTFLAPDFGLDRFLHPKAGRTLHATQPSDKSMTTPGAGRVSPSHAVPVEEARGEERGQEGSEPVMSNVGVGPDRSVAAAQPAALSSAEQDRLLVQAALAGDQSAFAELVTRYQSAVYNLAYRMLGDPTDAEDAAQEVFVRAWNQLRTFQLDRRFSTWLLSIASHHAIDMLRRRKPSAPLDDVALYVQSDEPEPDEIVLRSEQSEDVKRLLNTLPDKYRSVTVLRYYNDLSYNEIANMTGLTESAVKTQLHRARRMLADQLMATSGRSG
jgi:RNA polymerase sigma-70 factor (ECF subfamily)